MSLKGKTQEATLQGYATNAAGVNLRMFKWVCYLDSSLACKFKQMNEMKKDE